jgi:hypothetical protein
LEKDLDFSFGLIQLLGAESGQLNAFLEFAHRFFQGQISGLQLLDNFFNCRMACSNDFFAIFKPFFYITTQ